MKTAILNQFKALFEVPKKTVILGHKNPDGDALGASLGLHWFLKSLGHETQVIMPNDFPDFLKWMPGHESILVHDKQEEEVRQALKSCEVICTLDFNDLSRVGEMTKLLTRIDQSFVMIDHHQEPGDYASLTWSDTSMSSTSEMVAQLIESWIGWTGLNSAIATNLYTGIMTDTGSFKFPTTTAKTHRIVAALIDAGAPHSQIHREVYDTQTPGRLKLLGRALAQLEIFPDWHTAFTYLNQSDLDQCNFKKGDTEGLVNYALQLKGIKFALIFIENRSEKITKISLRSVGDFSVNDFARKHFDGGGHTNAAGGRYHGVPKVAIDYFLTCIPAYKNELNAA